MKRLCLLLLFLVACEEDSNALAPDAAPQVDAKVEPPEPKPAFAASPYMSGALAIDDAGIRETYLATGTAMPSKLSFALTQTGVTTSCSVTIKPHFVMFSTGSTSTRQFKTVAIDVAASTMLDDQCKWDDAYVLGEIANQFGKVYIGFAQARFTEDRPYLDVFYDADKTFPNSTANITRTGAGTGTAMAADGSLGSTMVQPAPGTLVPALYEF